MGPPAPSPAETRGAPRGGGSLRAGWSVQDKGAFLVRTGLRAQRCAWVPPSSAGALTDFQLLCGACLTAWTPEGPSHGLVHGHAGTVTLTCFIRSKSKASRATSFTLPTGFILERTAGRGKRAAGPAHHVGTVWGSRLCGTAA